VSTARLSIPVTLLDGRPMSSSVAVAVRWARSSERTRSSRAAKARLGASDADRLRLEAYIHGATTYYKVVDEARYMSVSGNDYIGFYSWSGASAFHQDGDYLVSDHNNQRLSFYSPENGYLYCYDKYTQLKVKFVAD